MSKFRNNKSNKNQGIHTIFGQHSVKAALQNDKRQHIELIISKNQVNFSLPARQARAGLGELEPDSASSRRPRRAQGGLDELGRERGGREVCRGHPGGSARAG